MSKTKDRLLTLSEQRDKESAELAEIRVCKELDELSSEKSERFQDWMEQSINIDQEYHISNEVGARW